mmetsp:Transcript_60620/g.179749  ORF Transcript_60620/g.179749 Transcript_60620/m.179749 type:complete len:305 (-) Transcript_60620:279-1193(-)|eukprot:CAMPEP_0113553262 /NCGR_PEP_ID=MMETSP0015_2-20120614/15518_1 /TAXON_ID=2838 /ORGANISM="Odontella" /LENGTH=304 /DNA_ID=CAMNT_0000454317 /DNA_START=161 /DNA_END=1075 /DNA_ORIENTATION=+ /assembly_acc=CAM_ASM_000160
MTSILSDDRASLKMGSCCFGIPITLHYTFFLLLVIELLASSRYLHAPFSFFMFMLYGPVLLLTIIIHELGHALATKKLGGECSGIVLWPLGGFALCGPNEKGATGDLQVALAGPLTHLPQMLFWIIVYALFTGGDFSNFSMSYYLSDLEKASSFMAILSQQTFWTNLFIMAFNLVVPAYPLDGGRVLASTLIICGVQRNRAAMITSVTALVLSAGLGMWGIISFIWLHSPNGLFTALIAAFVFASSWQLWDLYKAGRINDHPLFGRPCYDDRQPTTDLASPEQEGGIQQEEEETTKAEESGEMA